MSDTPNNVAKKPLTKTEKRFGYVILAVFAVLIIWIVLAASHALSSNSKPAAKHIQTASKTVTKPKAKPTTKQPAQPKPSIAALNSKAASILTDGTQHYATIFNNGKAEMSGNDWPSYYQNLIKSDDTQSTNSQKDASNLYTENGYNVPDAIGNWYSDINNVYSDINLWANKVNDYRGGSASSGDVTTAEQTYQSDLAAAQSDIKQL